MTIERYAKALKAIADWQPEWEPWEHPEPGCPDCSDAREKKWPPSGLCSQHYRPLAEWSSRMERRRANQYIDMKRVAQEALTLGGDA